MAARAVYSKTVRRIPVRQLRNLVQEETPVRFPRTLAMLSVALSTLIFPANAQQARQDSAALASAVSTLKNDLRNYVTAQEQYYAAHSTYAGTAQATTLRPSPGVTVVVLTFSPKGHNAVAIHKDVPGLVCAIWVGSHSRPLDDPSKEGAPSCRLPG